MSDKLRELVGNFEQLAHNCLCRHKSNPSYADEILHTKDTYEDLLEFCRLARAALAASEPSDQQQCSYCHEWYPKPIELHHCLEECDASIKANTAPSDHPVTSASDLQSKLEALRDQYNAMLTGNAANIEGHQPVKDKCARIVLELVVEELTAILEGK